MLAQTPIPVPPPASPPAHEETESSDAIDVGEPESDGSETPTPIEDNANPLTPTGNSLDRLIELKLNDDLWKGMQAGLPCLDTSVACIQQLQARAIANNLTLKQITERVEDINQKIEAARSRNEQSVKLGVLKPIVQYYVQEDTITRAAAAGQPAKTEQRGFFEKLVGILASPVSSINKIISLIGIPLLEGVTRSNDQAQARAIAISDLQVKVAQIEQEKAKAIAQLREAVVLQLLEFDVTRREFQVSQELVKRERLRTRIIEVDYRLGKGDTVQFLGNLSALDREKANTFKRWATLRSQLVRLKLMVLGSTAEE